jgi:hypothetical protein
VRTSVWSGVGSSFWGGAGSSVWGGAGSSVWRGVGSSLWRGVAVSTEHRDDPEQRPQPRQPALGQSFDRFGGASRHLGDLAGAQAADEAEHEHLALVCVEAVEQRQHLLGRGSFEQRHLAVDGWQRRFEVLGRRRVGWPAGRRASGIDQATVRDREHPGPEPGFVALEAVQGAYDLEEDLTDHVLGVRGALDPQVAEQGRSQVAVQLVPGALPTTAGAS